jgi:hypothetical protein
MQSLILVPILRDCEEIIQFFPVPMLRTGKSSHIKLCNRKSIWYFLAFFLDIEKPLEAVLYITF